MRYIDLLIERKKIRDEYLNNIDEYFRRIKKFFVEKLEDARVLVFGSYVKGGFGPESDIDILVISSKIKNDQEKLRLIYEIRKEIGFRSPFEFHIAKEEEYKNWWKNFIKNDYIEL
jgi:predicted nucleotidyltransferase